MHCVPSPSNLSRRSSLVALVALTAGVPAALSANDTPETKPESDAAKSASPTAAPMENDVPKIQLIDSEQDYNRLTPAERRVILMKGTERAFTGQYTDLKTKGTYLCRRCNAALYKSDSKFHSNCGWPSFDDEIEGAVKRLPDIDGIRIEIVCKNCDGHLGHVFFGERFTEKNTRHCVNSISMKFVPDGKPLPPTLVLRSKAEALGKLTPKSVD